MNKYLKSLKTIIDYPQKHSLKERNDSIDSIEELIDKETPMKVLKEHCTKCNEYIGKYVDNEYFVYCPICGQRLRSE